MFWRSSCVTFFFLHNPFVVGEGMFHYFLIEAVCYLPPLVYNGNKPDTCLRKTSTLIDRHAPDVFCSEKKSFLHVKQLLIITKLYIRLWLEKLLKIISIFKILSLLPLLNHYHAKFRVFGTVIGYCYLIIRGVIARKVSKQNWNNRNLYKKEIK